MRRIVVLVIVTLLLAAGFASLFTIQPIQGSRSNNSKAGDAPSFDWIFVIFLDVNASLYQAHPGTMIHIYVGINVTWDVFDFSSFWVEALYNGSAIGRKIVYLLGSGHDSFTLDFAWNTSGLEPGSYLISAATSTMVYYEDGYVRILQTLTVPDDYPTIQAAINAASDGDTVFVRNGTYYEHVVVNKTLNLKGENRNFTIIDGSETASVVTIAADNVRLGEFTIRNGGDSYAGVVLSSSRSTILNTTLLNNWCGIRLEHYSTHNLIAGNGIMSNLNGISGELWSNSTIVDNTLTDNLLGIWIGPYSSHNMIAFNTITNQWAEGISMWQSSNNTFEGNNIVQNNIGGFSSGIVIGFQVGFSSGNKFLHNNIVDNGKQIDLQGNQEPIAWDNGCEGNYWSDYQDRYPNASYDQYGIWNTSYVINDENVDRYPLRNPYWNIGDLNHDLKVDIFDLVSMCACYCLIWQEYMCHVDIAEPYGIINIFDVVTVAINYGKEYTP